jgi:hypothetical protein
MTDADWRACTSPIPMLEFLRNHGTPQMPWLRRKLRLLASGYCRRIRDRLPEGPYREAIEVIEQYADGEATQAQLKEARAALAPQLLPFEFVTREKIHRAFLCAMRTHDGEEDVGQMSYVALSTAWEIGELTSVPRKVWEASTPQWDAYAKARGKSFFTEQRLRADLVRDVIPSPLRKVEFDPEWLAWREETVTHIARAIYQEHRLDDVAILADALEEAGCTIPAILDHCRQSGPHLRGCWVVDLLLGK